MTKNKSITFFSNNYWTLYKFRYDIIQSFIDENYQINLIGRYDSYENKFNNPNIIKYNIDIDERGYNPFRELVTFFKIFLVYRKIKTSLIFQFTIKPNLYGSIISRLLNIKSIVFITGLGSVFIRKKTFLFKIIISFYRIALKKSIQVWFTNSSDLEVFKKLKIISNNHNTQIVPGCGLDTKFLTNKSKIINKKNILMVARIQKEKGVLNFLKLSSIHKNQGFKFILVGEYNHNNPDRVSRHILDQHISEGDIYYKEYTEDIDKIYADADCLILPSYREGISTVLLEAAAMRIPIITSDVPGCNDIIKDASFGFLCKPNDTDSLNNAFKRYINMPNDQLNIIIEKTSCKLKRSIIEKKYFHITEMR